MKTDLGRACLKMFKQLLAPRKYRQMAWALSEYVNELLVCRAADGDNHAWYTERLAMCAHLFSLLLTRDAIRFLRTFDQEVEAVARTPIMGRVQEMAISHWEEFKRIAIIWREKTFPSKQRGTK
jgi:hypothetical protein